MEGMIPIEEFNMIKNLINSKLVQLWKQRIEVLKENCNFQRKGKKMVAWKKMEKFFETQEEVTGFITGKVKGLCVYGRWIPTFMPSSQVDQRPLKKLIT